MANRLRGEVFWEASGDERDQDCNPIVSLTTNASDLTPQDMREGYLEMMPDDNSYKEI
jgi:hypothetical protein